VDLTEAADLATAGGTLILAIATFASIRSGQRAARIAERSLLAGLRPLLFPTRLGDPAEKVGFGDHHYVMAEGGRAAVEATDQAIYLAMTVRNVGSGLAVLDRWAVEATADAGMADQPAELSDFRRLTRDIYVPPNDYSFWQGALRDTGDPLFAAVRDAVDQRTQLVVQLLYGDMEGGQRTVSRFAFTPVSDGSWLIALTRHYYLDRDNPR
jgi:hypothetical protein